MLSCSVYRTVNTDYCSKALLKINQFNSLVEFGIIDSTVNNVVDLGLLLKINDTLKAQKEWEIFINDTRFLENSKTTLSTNYLVYNCSCKLTKDTIFFNLISSDLMTEKYKLLNRKDNLIIISKEVVR